MTSIFESRLFETILCMVLVFALLSLLASSVVEVVNTYFKERERMLYATISRMFDDNLNVNFGQLAYNHPIIENLRKNRDSLPRYINPEMFSNALIDVVANFSRQYAFSDEANRIEMLTPATPFRPFAAFRNGIDQMKHTDLKLVFLNMCDKCAVADKPLDELNLQIQQWYNSQMDRLTGWYKDKTSKSLWWVAALVALLMNVDAIHLFKTLYGDPVLRAQLIPVAEAVAEKYERLKEDTTLDQRERMLRAVRIDSLVIKDSVVSDTNAANKLIVLLDKVRLIDSLKQKIDSTRVAQLANTAQQQARDIAMLGLPLGWSEHTKPGAYGPFWLWLLGIFLSTYCLKAGAPFWFDILVKFVNLRKTGVRPDTSNVKPDPSTNK